MVIRSLSGAGLEQMNHIVLRRGLDRLGAATRGDACEKIHNPPLRQLSHYREKFPALYSGAPHGLSPCEWSRTLDRLTPGRQIRLPAVSYSASSCSGSGVMSRMLLPRSTFSLLSRYPVRNARR